MTTSSLRQLVLNSEPPSRREISIAVVTLYVIAFAILACKAVDYFRATDMETSSPSSQTDSRIRLA